MCAVEHFIILAYLEINKLNEKIILKLSIKYIVLSFKENIY